MTHHSLLSPIRSSWFIIIVVLINIMIRATSNTLDSMSCISHCIRSSVIKTQNCQSQTTESLTPLVWPDLKLVLLTFCWSMSDASKTLAASLWIARNVDCTVASHKDHISGGSYLSCWRTSVVYLVHFHEPRHPKRNPGRMQPECGSWKRNAVEVSSFKAIKTTPLLEPQLAPISTFPVNQNESIPNLSLKA